MSKRSISVSRAIGRSPWALLCLGSIFGCGGQISASDHTRECATPAGSYRVHEQLATADGDCSGFLVPDTMIDFPGTAALLADAGAVTAFRGCTTDAMATSCTFSGSCTTKQNGLAIRSDVSYSFVGDNASGTETVTVFDASGKTAAQCVFNLTLTRS